MFQPKRQKVQNEENSPYKVYLEKDKTKPDVPSFVAESAMANSSKGSSSLTPEVKRLCFVRSQSESALTPCSIKKALERSKNTKLSIFFSNKY